MHRKRSIKSYRWNMRIYEIKTTKKIKKRKAPKEYKGQPLPVIWLSNSKLPEDTVIVKGMGEQFYAYLDGDRVIISTYHLNPKERTALHSKINYSDSSFTLIVEK